MNMTLLELTDKCKGSGIIMQMMYFDVFNYQFKKGIHSYQDALADFTPEMVSVEDLGIFLYSYIIATYEYLCDKIGKPYTKMNVYCNKSHNNYWLYLTNPDNCDTAEDQVAGDERFDKELNLTDIHYKRHGVVKM